MEKILKFIKKYGWIILSVVVILFYIAYLTVMNQADRPLLPRCAFTDKIECEEFQIVGNDGSGNGILQFRAINQGEVTNFSFIATRYEGIDPPKLTTHCTVDPRNGNNIVPKESMEVTCVFNEMLMTSGNNVKIDITTNSEVTGQIFGRAK